MVESKKPIITLVGLKQAKKDFSFIFEGYLKECENCPLFKICVEKLELRRAYVVTNVRDKTFPCNVHEEGVKVVEVVEPNAEVTIEKRLAFPMGIITFQPQKCKEELCEHYKKCVPLSLELGDKCRIVEVKESVECPLNRQLVLSILQRLIDSV